MKNINPPPTLPVLPVNHRLRVTSGINSLYNNTMVDLASGKYLTGLGVDFDIKRPTILFGDDDLWRAMIKVLAFGHRHTRDSVRRALELLLAPRVSQATILDREFAHPIIIGDLLDIQSGPNLGNYTIAGVTAHELIFPSGTFGTVPDAGPITFSVGEGPVPIVGGTTSTHGRIYTAADGTERFIDLHVPFLNIHPRDFLTQLNKLFPQYGTVVFDKNSPVEETERMAYYDYLQTGMMKTKGVSQMEFTHPKYQPIRSSVLSSAAEKGALTLDLDSVVNFPANAAPVPVIVTVIDFIDILQGVNAGNYQITAIESNRLTIDSGAGLLTVTGKDAGNNFKITPVATPPGSKGTIFGDGGVESVFSVGPANFAVFRDDSVDFTTLVDPDTTTNTGYSVRINRGELTEEVIQVESLGPGSQLHLLTDPLDTTGQTSLLGFTHYEGELVEIEGLSYSANSTYFTTSTVTGGGLFDELIDGSANFPNQLLNLTSDVEFITGANAGQRRTIEAVPAATRIQWALHPLPAPVVVGDEYRIIKRYSASNLGVPPDNILYLDDTSGLPASNFTAIVDRGTEHEEVLYISANDITATPNTLTISNNDIGTAFCAKDHGSSFSVEAAQVLILGCNWDIIETQATGEYTIAASASCVPQIDLKSFYLHADVDLSKLITAAPFVPQVAHITSAISAGDTEFTMDLMGANSFASALENVGDRDGILNRSLKFDDGVNIEEVFATRQKYYTKVDQNYTDPGGSPSNTITVKDAKPFESLIPSLPFDVVISRNNSPFHVPPPHPSVIETIQLTGMDLATNTFTFVGNLVEVHHIGDPIELLFPVIRIADVFENSFATAAPVTDINLLYLDPIYRLEDPYNIGTFTEVPQGNLIEVPPHSSYLPITPLQAKKSIFPGSYVYNLPDADYPINDQPSSVVTQLASAPSGLDITAAYKIPLSQEILGSRPPFPPLGLLTPGLDVGPGTIEILVADGRLFPDTTQNPFYIVLDFGFNNEETVQCVGKVANPIADYPFAYALIVDPTEAIKFTHYSKKFLVEQVFDVSKVDLEVHKLVVNSVSGFGDDGGIFIDYGFNNNSELLYNINIDTKFLTGAPSAATGGGATFLIDADQTFQKYYFYNPLPGDPPTATLNFNALAGAFIILREGTVTQEINIIRNVPSDDRLDVLNPWVVNPAPGDPYRIYGYIPVDDSEFGTNLTHAGGVISNAGGTENIHPAREGGISQEYVTFKSKVSGGGDIILTLSQPTVFKKVHPPGTQVILGTGTVGPKIDGSSYQPFLYSDFFTALFHKDVGDFDIFIRAAGIETKAEDTDA